MTQRAFFDSNVPLYLLSGDPVKAEQAENLLAEGGTISVQVLNEVAAVARCRFKAEWDAIDELLASLREVCDVEDLTVAVHERAIGFARRHGMPVYDAMIASSAIAAGCTVLYTEDFQHGRVLDGLTIRNPFR